MTNTQAQIVKADHLIRFTRKMARWTYIGVIALGLAFIAGGSDLIDIDPYWADAMGNVGVGLITAAVIGVLLGPVDRALTQADQTEATIEALKSN